MSELVLLTPDNVDDKLAGLPRMVRLSTVTSTWSSRWPSAVT